MRPPTRVRDVCHLLPNGQRAAATVPRALALVVLTMMATTLAGATASHAAPSVSTGPHLMQASDSPADAPSSLSIDVTRVRSTIEPDGALELRVQVTNRSRQEREGLRVVVTMHQRTRSRYEYQQAVDAGVVGAVVHAFTADLGPVPAQASRTIELEQSAQELGVARAEDLQGVYPLRLQLLEGDEVADEVVTSLVAVSGDVAYPLAVALVLTLDHPPARDADGAFVDLDLAEAVAPDGLLTAGLQALTSGPAPPVTVAADAHMLEEVTDLARGFLLRQDGDEPLVLPSTSAEAHHAEAFLRDLRRSLADPRVELLGLPFASADLVALVRAGLGSEASRHLTEGRRALESLSGIRPSDDMLVPPDAISEEALTQALATGTRAVLLSSEHVRMPQITGATPSSLRRLRVGPGAGMTGVVGDPWLEATLADPQGTPALRAQRILGELATIYFERPNQARRGVMLRVPHEQAAGLFAAVGTAPFLDPATMSRFRRAVREEPDLVRLAYPPEARVWELTPAYVARLSAARRALGSLDGVLVTDRATPGRLDRVLLQAASTHYRPEGAPAQGDALLGAVMSTVDDLYAQVVVPETPAVTLTSLEGEVPVTLRSGASVPLRVRVHLRTARLEVDGGPVREVILEPDSTHVVMFPVRALNPGGTAPVEVQVTDADGVMVLATGRVVVRSTAMSVTAVLVVIGAALFLLLWLLQEAAQRRQRRRASAPDPRSAPATGAQRTAERVGTPHPRAGSRDGA